MGQYYLALILDETGKITRMVMPGDGEGAKLMEHAYINTNIVSVVEHWLIHHPQRVVWAGDYAQKEPNEDLNLYHKAEEPENLKLWDDEKKSHDPTHRFIVNHNKKLILKLKDRGTSNQIHPLPLLTAEGNGEGCGDYYGKNEDQVGTWSRDLISVETDDSVGAYRDKGYAPFKISFREGS